MIRKWVAKIGPFLLLALSPLLLAPSVAFATASPDGEHPTIEKIDMVTGDIGWLLTQTHLWRTIDGGLRWNAVLTWAKGTYFPVAQFRGSDVAVVATNVGVTANTSPLHLDATTNGGTTWTVENLGHPSSPSLGIVDSIDIEDARNTWVLTGQNTRKGSDEPMALYHTANAGRIWARVIQVSYGDHVVGGIPLADLKTDVAFQTPRRGWLVGVDKGDKVWMYHTTSGGRSWQSAEISALPHAFRHNADASIFPEVPVFAATGSAMLPVFFANSGSGLCVYATSDDGATWSLGQPVKGGEGLAVDPYDGTVIFADAGRALEISENQGASWSVITKSAPPAPAFLSFANRSDGFLVDWDNGLWKTTDGGVRWTSVPMEFLASAVRSSAS
ncbi:MAG: hypothetical protein OWU32_09725, partial [Firmicutes bacterium]|nr:hypothetical protein [Bacillota bacterium]